MGNDTVIKLIQLGTFNDQLTDVLRNGARALLARQLRPRSPIFSARKPISRPRTATGASCAMAFCPSATS
jgi:hypothetical protein